MSTVIEKPWFLKEIKIKQKHITLNPKVKKLGWILLKMKLQIAWYKENNQSQLILSVKFGSIWFFLMTPLWFESWEHWRLGGFYKEKPVQSWLILLNCVYASHSHSSFLYAHNSRIWHLRYSVKPAKFQLCRLNHMHIMRIWKSGLSNSNCILI